ncbi:hypothetical protein PIB30_098232, partial [Stylosanthes scabra]|nr:hypothetical protein [Stylosanthes scabra]
MSVNRFVILQKRIPRNGNRPESILCCERIDSYQPKLGFEFSKCHESTRYVFESIQITPESNPLPYASILILTESILPRQRAPIDASFAATRSLFHPLRFYTTHE